MAETGFPLMLTTTCVIMYGEYCVYTAMERSMHTCTVWKLNLFGFFLLRTKNIHE